MVQFKTLLINCYSLFTLNVPKGKLNYYLSNTNKMITFNPQQAETGAGESMSVRSQST